MLTTRSPARNPPSAAGVPGVTLAITTAAGATRPVGNNRGRRLDLNAQKRTSDLAERYEISRHPSSPVRGQCEPHPGDRTATARQRSC